MREFPHIEFQYTHILREKNLCILFLYLLFMEISYCFLHWFFVLVLNGTFFCMEFLWKNAQFFYSFPTSHCPPPLIRFHHFSFKTWSFPPSCSCRIAFVIGVRYGESKLPLELLLHCTSHISTHSALWENTGGQTVISAKDNWFQGYRR